MVLKSYFLGFISAFLLFGFNVESKETDKTSHSSKKTKDDLKWERIAKNREIRIQKEIKYEACVQACLKGCVK